ncbi:hypothetical protein AAF712_013276 [Marasmius tenuissimus]|uniref:F-box domain-containing protein n=1 Tax=Marasmius tenuissimus TaxID=585030 RepID=A0ABR2ZFD4_9AGAR
MSNALLPRSLPNEVVKKILRFLHRDLARQSKVLPLGFALVAKSWFPIWASLRWKVTDIGQLFNAITVGGKFFKRRRPTEAQWIRFETIYARWVEEIRIEPGWRFLNPLGLRRLFNLLIRRYPASADRTKSNTIGKRILPNLRSININYLTAVETSDMVGYLARIVYMVSHAGVGSFNVRDNERVLRKAGIAICCVYQGHTTFQLGKKEHVVVSLREFEVRGPERFREWLEILGAAFSRTSAGYLLMPTTGGVLQKLRRDGCKSSWVQTTYAIDRRVTSSSWPPCLPALIHPYHLLRSIDLKVEAHVVLELFKVVRSKFKGALGLPHLKKIRLELTPDRTTNLRADQTLRCLFEAIAGIAPLTLEEVRVCVHPSPPEVPFMTPENLVAHDRAIGYEMLDPLRACPRLQTLDIRDIYPVMIDNEELVTLTRSWPGLVNLYLGFSTRRAVLDWGTQGLEWSGQAIDLGALEGVCEVCKRLKRVAIMMGEQAQDQPEKVSGGLKERMNLLRVPVDGTGFSCFVGYPKEVAEGVALTWVQV